MINRHRKLEHWTPHCFICGEEVKKTSNCISIKGRFCDSGNKGNTIWLHLGCASSLKMIIDNDLSTVDSIMRADDDYGSDDGIEEFLNES